MTEAPQPPLSRIRELLFCLLLRMGIDDSLERFERPALISGGLGFVCLQPSTAASSFACLIAAAGRSRAI